ncbi:fish-egg lectin-like [Astyanax mexicanus]|uniref:Fish-egg lectin-like n=1 Tax=Astyanax mexicanus TaxID=7994 RepID=A0A8T2KTH1_ASTMX|nr:fish-egg lectin-like [Astyanax mexicanus]
MERTAVLLVILNLWTSGLALNCRVVPGSLKQIDVGNGQVFGVNSADEIFTLYSGAWTRISGSLKHVSVGPAGVWGVNANNYIYRLDNGDWVPVNGQLKQVDAGGTVSPAGINMFDDIFCLQGGQGASWTNLPGKLKYYSCGLNSCWGVNSGNLIYIMKGVTSNTCAGSLKWEQVSGYLSMIEVSTDGKVYGVNSNGDMYTREGITSTNPTGTGWRQVQFGQKVKHVSYDLGHLWVIGTDNSIMDCTE